MYNTIGLSVVYIDTGSPVPNIASKSRGLADENNKLLTNGNDSNPTTVLYKTFAIESQDGKKC